MSEQVVGSKYQYRGKVLNLRLDDVRLANGHVALREIVEHRGAVAMVALDAAGRVLMVRQYRAAAGRELLEIPAGTLEEGEEPATAAPRELKEETGYTAAQWQALGYFYSSPGISTEKMYLYLARQLTAAQATPEEDEAITMVPVPLADALAMIERGEILDAKTIVGLLRVERLLYAPSAH